MRQFVRDETEGGPAIVHRSRRYAACAFMLASVPLVGLAPATSQADDGCAPDMYFNLETNQCECYVEVTVYVDPCCYIPGPVGIGPIGPGPVGPGPIGPRR
jgi:hypothetical protein